MLQDCTPAYLSKLPPVMFSWAGSQPSSHIKSPFITTGPHFYGFAYASPGKISTTTTSSA